MAGGTRPSEPIEADPYAGGFVLVGHRVADARCERFVVGSTRVTFSFRPLSRDQFPLLSGWLCRPHVADWWRDPGDLASLEAQYGPGIDGVDKAEVFIIEREGAGVGLIQRYDTDDNPEWKRALAGAGVPGRSVGIDYLIGEEELIGQGLGPRLIADFIEDTWQRYPEISVIAVAVQQGNRRSWRAVEKVGFQRVWAGMLDSDDPSDDGLSYVYVLHRPGAGASR